ncbi:MAG: hypothetical protein ACE14L_02790 [Terriglobales bacterium]
MKLFLILLVLTATVAAQQAPRCTGPRFARRSVNIESSLLRVVKSPDRQKRVYIRHIERPDATRVLLTAVVGPKRFSLRLDGRGVELLWSPDSRLLAVNLTNCCTGRDPELHLFDVSAGGVRKLDITPALTRDFGKDLRCQKGTTSAQSAATAALHWLDDHRLLAAVRVPAGGVCDSPGIFEVREISVPEMRVLNTYNQLQAKWEFWHLLGCDLRAADNNCILHPKSCWNPALHGKR